MVNEKILNVHEINEMKIKELLRILTWIIEADWVSAIGEFAIWHQQIKTNTTKNATEAFIGCNKEIFPTVHRILLILITLPVTILVKDPFPPYDTWLFKKHNWWKSPIWFSGYEYSSRCRYCNHERNNWYNRYLTLKNRHSKKI